MQKKRVNKPENLSPTTPTIQVKTADLHPSVNTKNEIISPSSILTYQFFSVNHNQLVWPKANKLWEIVGDSTDTYDLHSIFDTDVYPIPTYYSCSHL